MRKRKKDDSSGEGAYWMDTYGDMVTLLLTFFVLLFSFSTIDAAKWMELANALSGTPIVAVEALSASDVKAPAIEGQNTTDKTDDNPSSSASDSNQGMGNISDVEKQFDKLYQEVKSYIEINGLGDKLNVEKQKNGLILIRMAESALFNSGSAQITSAAKEMLPPIFEIIDKYDDLLKVVRIEGHTDNVPIQNAAFEDNWMLSYTRAHEVVLYMQSVVEIAPEKIDPAGQGEHHPVASNDTEEGKARNRRVDFLLESILSEEETQ